MNVSLTSEFERLVEKKVKSGLYQSASEVVREGLRLLEERDRFRDAKLTDLRREIAIGVAQADRGEIIDGATVFRRLRKKAKTTSRKRA